MNYNPYILLDENSWENYLISVLSPFLWNFNKNFIMYAYFAYAATASNITDDVMMTSQSWSCIEYLIPTYSTLVLP